MTQNVEMMLCFLMWPKLCKKRASTLKYFSWGKWLVTSSHNLSIYLPLKSFLSSLLLLGNCKTPFSYQMAPYAKTDTIFAYCVLQVGIYEARAAQKWPQKWIWWLLNFCHFWRHYVSKFVGCSRCFSISGRIWEHRTVFRINSLDGYIRVLAKCEYLVLKFNFENSLAYKCVGTSESTVWPLPHQKHIKNI